MRVPFAILITVSILSLFFSTVQAQDLSLNSSIESHLDSGSDDRYAFVAREGQLISFVARSADELDAMLRIENLNGDIVLSNDDYDYPDSKDAIIEGFVAPYTGSFSLIVAGYGSTSGNYTLEMLSGYSTLITQELFSSNNGWQAKVLDPVDRPELNIVNGTANLHQAGIDRTGLATGIAVDGDVYFARVRIDSISDNAGWRAGIVFGYRDERNFHRVLINHRGAWRLVATRNGEETVLRDWNVHPAISPDTRSFSLGVLVNGNSFDIFYSDQFIGSGIDSNFRGGQIGLVAESIDAIASEVTVRFDDLTITSPTPVNDSAIFPAHIIASGIYSSVRELEQRLLIPVGGEMAFTLTENFARNNREGVSRFAIGDGRTATNFALGTRVSWAAMVGSNLNACGLVFRDDGAENYVIAYVDSEGGAGIGERSGSEFIQNTYNARMNNTRPPYDIVLIVRDDTVHYYLNGIHIASLQIGIREGAIAGAVVNFEAVNTNCQFNNLWVWQW